MCRRTSGDGLNFVSPTTTEILNCNVVNNSGYGVYGLSGTATTRINNSVVFGNNDNTIPAGQYIGNNVQSNPPFRFPYVQGSCYVKYQLSPNSTSCIDAGNTMLVGYYPIDLYGQDRVIDSIVDIGAVETIADSDCDANNDGIVDLYDYAGFAELWGLDENDPAYDVDYDFDDDGSIGLADLKLLAGDWLYGALTTGTLTSTCQVDFGYRIPVVSMAMSMPAMESVPANIMIDTSVNALLDSELATTGKVTVDERFKSAKSQLKYDPLSLKTTGSRKAVSQVNIMLQDRQLRRNHVESIGLLVEFLDEMWLNGQLGDSISEQEYLDFRNSVQTIQ